LTADAKLPGHHLERDRGARRLESRSHASIRIAAGPVDGAVGKIAGEQIGKTVEVDSRARVGERELRAAHCLGETFVREHDRCDVRFGHRIVHRIRNDRWIETHAELAGQRIERVLQTGCIDVGIALGHPNSQRRDGRNVDTFLRGIDYGCFELEIERLARHEVGAGNCFDAQRIFRVGGHFDSVPRRRIARPTDDDRTVGIEDHHVGTDGRTVANATRDRYGNFVAECLGRLRFGAGVTRRYNIRAREDNGRP
jgi:hypothetical protein